MPHFQGVFTAIVTPFREGGAIDFATLGRLIEDQVAGGVTGIVPCGTTGESPTLSHEEHREVIRFTVERVGGRVEVMAGCGSNATREAIELTEHAAKVGATSTLQVCPYYNKPSQEGLYRHFAAIAAATPLPVCLYNIPGRTGISLAPETVARLAALPTVRGIKEATGSIDQASHILSLSAIDVLSGDDSLTLPLLAVGATGVVSVAANLVPRDVVDVVRCFAGGDPAGARALHRKLFPLCRAMFCETNPVPVKQALALLGRAPAEVRLPLAPLAESSWATVRKALVEYGLLAG